MFLEEHPHSDLITFSVPHVRGDVMSVLLSPDRGSVCWVSLLGVTSLLFVIRKYLGEDLNFPLQILHPSVGSVIIMTVEFP